MIPSGMKARFFGATCNTCGCAFKMPVLSDFDYGEFVFHGRAVHGYLNAITEPVWDDIVARLRAKGLLPEKSTDDEHMRMRAVMAALADRIGGQPLFEHPICPHCNSHDVANGDSTAGGYHELPTVTFAVYTALTDEQRDAIVADAWKQAVVRPKIDDDLFEKMRAMGAIFSVFRMFKFEVGSDIRLSSHWHLFEDSSASRDELEWALEFMQEKRWLIKNDQPGSVPGGHCLTPAGLAAMESLPLAELRRAPLKRHGNGAIHRGLIALALGAFALIALAAWHWLAR